MANYSESRKEGKFLGLYVCSKCKSVILRDFEFYAAEYSRMSLKKAKEAASEASEQGMAALKAFKEKPFLVTSPVEDRSYWLVSGFGTNGLEKGCPYCDHRENWQLEPEIAERLPKDPETGVALVQDVPEWSRMTIAPAEGDTEAIQKMHIALAQHINDASRKYWEEHPEEAASVRAQLDNIKKQIAEITAQKDRVKAGLQNLAKQVRQKEEEMKGLSMFSGERKTCKAELKSLEKQYDSQRMETIEKESQFGKNIQACQKQMKDVLIKNPGILNELEQIVPADTQSIGAIRLN